MIEKLHVKNFKCLDDLEFDFSNITVLSGLNGMGKSTLIQCLLILQQSYTDQPKLLSTLIRNGSLIELGATKDVLWEGAKDEVIEFTLTHHEGSHKFAYYLDIFDDSPDEFILNPDFDISPLPRNIGLFSDRFHYLHAERWGPRKSLPLSNVGFHTSQALGRDGEYAAQFLALNAENIVENISLRHPSARSNRLQHQVEAWLGEISPGSRLYIQTHTEIDRVSVSVAFAGGSGETNHYRPTNVGFGISYCFPIIVAALSSPPNSLLLIENPEAHLHPHGQRKMAELLGLASLGAVQIITETHSDHFLNGLRLAVHAGRMAPDDISLLFFEREQSEHSIRVNLTTPKINASGRIDQWPSGFFDESEKALRQLLFPPGSTDDRS